MAHKHIVLGVTASIALYKACDLVRRLKDQGFDVTVIMTEEAQKLISPLVFQSLSGRRVYTGMFDQPDAWEIEHVALAQKADLVLIAPATANIIGKLACGICDDLLTCVVCATGARVMVCPAMNDRMYRNPITQGNIKTLRSHGVTFVEPATGKLACGTTGTGCLADIADIVKEAKKHLK